MARTPASTEPTEIPLPPSGGRYRWDETSVQWVRIDEEGNPLSGEALPSTPATQE